VVSERPLRPELIATARDYMDAARAENTRRAYRRSWAFFEAWCAREGRHALPANPETVAAWMGWAAKGLDGQRPWKRSTINQALSAVVLAQRQFHGERIAKLCRRRDDLDSSVSSCVRQASLMCARDPLQSWSAPGTVTRMCRDPRPRGMRGSGTRPLFAAC
jgi:hypothetical protein